MKYIAMLVCGVALLAAPQKSDEPERWLQMAIQAETVDGDLKSAIDQYKKIIGRAGANREVVAKALVRLGMCYEREGNAEARKQYERAVREFADQAEAVGQARERLAALRGPAAGKSPALAARQVWAIQKDTGGHDPHDIEPAADGRSLLYTDSHTGDIGIRNMSTGEIKPLGLRVEGSAGEGAAFSALYSPDQRRIAYTWLSPGDHRYQLRLISTEPGAKPRVLVNHDEIRYLQPFGWSPDGKSILTLMWKLDGTSSIAWVSSADGTFKTLRSLEWRNPEKASLSPDGRYIAYDALEHPNRADRDIYILAADGSSEAVAVANHGIDNNPVWTPDGSHLVFTSNRSRNFGLYAVAVELGNPQGEARLLKPEVGRIAMRGFAGAGALYYVQSTSEQNIYKAELEVETGKVRGAPVPLAGSYNGLNDMAALSPDGKFVAYLSDQKSLGGGPGAYTLIVKSLESGIERAFPTDLNVSDTPTWYADGRALLLGTDSDPPTRGRTFCKLDLDSGAVTPLARVSGFAAASRWGLSRDGDTLYMPGRDIEKGVGSVLALTLSTGQVKTLYESSFGLESSGRIDAVSLSPDGQTLVVAKAREVLLMDTSGGSVRPLVKAWGIPGVAWAADGKRIFFAPGEQQVWSVPVTGGDPAPTGIRVTSLRNIGAAGSTLTFSAGRPEKAELWAFDNLLPMLKASR